MKPRDWAVMTFFAGPAAAMGDEVTSYALQKHTLVVTAVAAVVALVGILGANAILRRRTEVFPVDKFVATAALVMNAFFLFVIIFGFGIPKVVVHPTD